MSSIVQESITVDDGGGSATTIATTITGVTAGNLLVAFVGSADSGSSPTCSVSDGVSYTIAGAAIRDAGNTQSSWVFFQENVGSGSHTVTATLGSSLPYRRIRVIEISGLNTSSVLDQATQAFDNTSPFSSGVSAATTNATDLILGFSQNTWELPASLVAAGSGYTLIGTNYEMAAEWKEVTSTGTQEATFTGTNGGHTNHVVAFKLVSGGGGPSGVQTGARYMIGPWVR